jgi:hypothetical protein
MVIGARAAMEEEDGISLGSAGLGHEELGAQDLDQSSFAVQ